MEARLSKPDSVHYYCEKNADYFNIWLNPKLLVPLVIDCWIDNIRLIYDPVTRKTANPQGVDIRIPGWGQSEVVEWLDPSITRSLAGAYFKDVANLLVNRGWVRNVTLRGAPYDFRRAPSRFFQSHVCICIRFQAVSNDNPSSSSSIAMQMKTNNGFWI